MLVVEDTKANYEVCCELLMQMGHSTTVANNGVEAVEFTPPYSMPLLERAPLDAIKELRRPGFPDILAKVISMYESDSPQLILAMRNGLEQNNTEELIRAVHSLKTSSAMLGAQQLADQCHIIEKTLRDGEELKDAKAVIDSIEIMCQAATVLLRNELEGEAG